MQNLRLQEGRIFTFILKKGRLLQNILQTLENSVFLDWMNQQIVKCLTQFFSVHVLQLHHGRLCNYLHFLKFRF